MPAESNVLLIIDNEVEHTSIQRYFLQFDYEVIIASDLSHLQRIESKLAAILLHICFIQQDSTILETLFLKYAIPIIIIDDHYDELSCVKALEAGADDYLTKPILPRELHARLNAITRRIQIANDTFETDQEVLEFANWRLFPASRRLLDFEGNELSLSASEYTLLLAFVHQPQRVLARELLLQYTKNDDLLPFDRRIDVQISRLRQKIEVDKHKPVLIKTIRNGGYLFTAPVKLSKVQPPG